MFKQGNRLLVTSFLFCISSKQPGLIKRGSKRKRISRSHRKQNYCGEREVYLCVMSSGARNRWGKNGRRQSGRYLITISKIDHPKNVRLYLQSFITPFFFSVAGNQVVLNENKMTLEG